MTTISAPPHNAISVCTLGNDEWAIKFQSGGLDRKKVERIAVSVRSWRTVHNACASRDGNSLIVVARWRWLYRFLLAPIARAILREMDFLQGQLTWNPLPGQKGADVKTQTVLLPDYSSYDPHYFPPSGMI